MTCCIAGIQYLPSIEYFAHWIYHGVLLFEKHETYHKRTWRNKTIILGSQYPLSLSVPLRKGKNRKMPITDVEISYDDSWHRNHLASIQTSYGKTAFFDEIESNIEAIYLFKPQFLWEMNLQLIRAITSFFPGEWKHEFTQSYDVVLPATTIDLRTGVPAGYSSSTATTLPVYDQIHRLTDFHLPNLSILDVLCHLGPGTYDYLKRYAAELYNTPWLK